MIDLAHEDDLVVPLFDGDGVVFEAVEGFRELCEFVVVGGEEGAGSVGIDIGVEVLDHGPGDGEAVVGAGAAADLVEDDEAAGGGVVEDVGGLVHLDHEGGVAACELVAGADAGEDAVDEAEAAVRAGTHAPDWAMSTMRATWRM